MTPTRIRVGGLVYVRADEVPAPAHQRCRVGFHWDGHKCRPVAGYTPDSNKPIYKVNAGILHARHPLIQADRAKDFVRRNHRDFTPEEHDHAAKVLQQIADKHGAHLTRGGTPRPYPLINMAKSNAYDALAQAHRRAARKKRSATT